jgi:large subunit ribosomal protein L21
MAIYAVMKTGGKQYRVAPGDIVMVEKLAIASGAMVEISEVYLLAIEHTITVGHPTVANARIVAEVIGEGRDKKVIAFKKKRRKGYQRTLGHRQHFTTLRIREIVLGDNIYRAAATVSRADVPRATKAAPVRPLSTQGNLAEPRAIKSAPTPKAPSPKVAPPIEPESLAQAERGSVVDPRLPDRELVRIPPTVPEPISPAPQPLASGAPPRERSPAGSVETTVASPAQQAELPRTRIPPTPQPGDVEAPASRKRWYWLAAAVVALLIGTGILLLSNLGTRAPANVVPVAAQPEVAAPSQPKPAVTEAKIKRPAAGGVPSAPVQPPD